MKMTQHKLTGAALASNIAAQEFSKDFADLLTVFNTEAVNRAILGLFATTHRGDMPIRYDELCRGLLDLIDRGVLVAEFHSDLADEELQELHERFAPQSVPSTASSGTPTAQAPAVNLVDECANDFRTLDSTHFRLKWMGQRRSVYEAAIAAGRI
jgi:hypothetical protein